MQGIIETLGGPSGIWWLAGAYFGMIIAERLVHLVRRTGAYNDADALCSIGLNLMNNVIGLGVGFLLPLALYVTLYDNARLFTIGPVWLSAIVAFLVHELSYYAEHRLGHRVGLLWAFHAIHHSSNEFNHSTAARGFFFDGFLQGVFAWTAALLGIAPVIYFGVMALKNIYGVWNHASYVGRLGWLTAFSRRR